MSKLPKVKIEIDGVEYAHTFNQDVQIDRTNLEHEFCSQAEIYAFYSFLSDKAKYQMERSKLAQDQVYAALDHEKRVAHEEARSMNPKHKFTEKMVENEVITDPRFRKAKLAYLDAKLMADQLLSAARSISQRKDMLCELGYGNRIGTAPTRVNDEDRAAVQDIIRNNRRTQ